MRYIVNTEKLLSYKRKKTHQDVLLLKKNRIKMIVLDRLHFVPDSINYQ